MNLSFRFTKRMVIYFLFFSFFISAPLFAKRKVESNHDEAARHPGIKEKGKIFTRGKHKKYLSYKKREKNLEKFFNHIVNSKDKLTLTDEQVKEILLIQFEFKKEHIRIQADLKIAKLDFSELISADDYNLHDAVLLVNEISDLIARGQKERFMTIVDVFEILTSVQRKKVNAMHLGKFSYSDFIMDH